MPEHVAINPRDHKDLRILEERSEAMGDGQMCCVTFPAEFRNLQAHYPILFQRNEERDQYLCLAMFGFENGENLFLNDRKWDARYIPLAMDILPFMIGKAQSEGEDQKVVIDLASPRLAKGEGQRLFDENGMATTFLDNISKKLGYLDGGFMGSSEYIDLLLKYELLEPLSIDVTLRDGSQNRLMGFHTIHEEKFADMSASGLQEFKEKGYLLATYMVLASLSNLADLIKRKDRLNANDG